MDTTSNSKAEQGMLPDIDGARCVHSISHLASCNLCIEACPDDALVMNDELFGVNEEVCTGCGLCQPSCPQNAIFLNDKVPCDKHQALLACQKAPDAKGGLAIFCIHSQGLEQIAQLYKKGVRQLAMSTGNCDDCHTGKKAVFFDHLSAFNRLAESRHLPPIEVIDYSPSHWLSWLEEKARTGIASKGRRAFLHSLVAPVIEEEVEPEKSTALADFLKQPEDGHSGAWYISVPAIDPQKCNGCDACINICPENALILVKEEPSLLQYTFLSHLCTGCGLCVDVCQMSAISLDEMTTLSTGSLALKAYSCKSCGAGFHLPDFGPEMGPDRGNGNSDLCRICSMTNHNRKLFQVLT